MLKRNTSMRLVPILSLFHIFIFKISLLIIFRKAWYLSAFQLHLLLSEHFADSYGHGKNFIVYKRSVSSMGNSWFVSHDMILYLIRKLYMFPTGQDTIGFLICHYKNLRVINPDDSVQYNYQNIQPFRSDTIF